jgi:ABC-type antimicrobial peptide transport system permease subunit
LILRETGILLAAGLGVGVVISLAAGRAASALLYNVQPGDPLTLLGAASILALVAFAASYLPTWRASAIDPATALRQE